MLDFRILGPVEVVEQDRRLPLGGAKQRALLAILLLHRREPVSTDRLIDELWGEDPPATANKALQGYVSQLRKVLGADLLITRGGGYELDVERAQVDLDRFEQLAGAGHRALEAGDAERASKTLREALALWRGPPLADLTYERFAQLEIGRLEEARLAALEDRIDAELALGQHAAVAGELEALVQQHPHRERLQRQLMLALYRSGRQADALERYRRAREALVGDLGIEPGAELQQLERAILAQDPALDAPPSPSLGERLAARSRVSTGALLIAGGGFLLLAAAIAAAVVSSDGGRGVEVSPNSVAAIDASSGELVADIPVGARPADISADEHAIWVGNFDDDTTTQVDPRSMTVVSTTSPKTSVSGLAAGAGGVWIGDRRRSELVRIDPVFRSVGRPIQLDEPAALGFSSDNTVAVGHDSVWVGTGDGAIARVDPERNAVIDTIAVGNGPIAIAAGVGGVWIADNVDNTVTRIEPASSNAVTGTTPVGQGPAAVATGEGAVWVANAQDDTVVRVDPRTASVIATIPVGSRPTGVAAGAGAVWVANSLSGTVSRIDPKTNRVEQTVDLGESPHGVTVAHGLVWVSVQARAAPPESPVVTAEGDVARVLVGADPGPTDPALLDPSFQDLYFATCAQLYNYTDRPFPEGARLQPEVAAGQSVSDGGRTYTFRIRSGFRFSPPSNETVTAAAFERAIERALHPTTGSFAAEIVPEIKGAEAYIAGRTRQLAGVSVRGNTLIVELTRPAPDLIARLATPWFCAVPPNTPISRKGVDALPSAGPYYVASHQPDRSLVLRRNPNYDGPRPQSLAEIQYEIGVPPDRGVKEVEGGRADYVQLDPVTASASAAARVLRRLEGTYGPSSEAARAGRQQLFTQPTLSAYYFVFNSSRGPFTDARLRRAVNYAIDRRALSAHTGLSQRGRPTDQYVPPGMAGFEDAAIYPLGGPDVAAARRLAGGARRQAVLYTCNTPGCTRHAEILRSNLGAIGIELDVRQFALGQMFGRVLRPGEPWDLTYWNWFADYADPLDFINVPFGSGGLAPGGLRGGALKGRMAAAARLSGDDRLRASARLDHDLARHLAPAAPFASGTITHFLSARMGCQTLHPIYGLDLAALCVRGDDAE